ncbi:beta-lactamase family protein [Lutibacter sp. A64]|uniref:serine hydrolase domain-containing protein n=1 Tax=Lutibacter sp. A64 TaxID=2918526 RepID=UPI001F06EDE4|nr:serine hydrolase domain-containing protein [Lutibacter sp. A64]UMB53464.1 beta-lactamase family protein [Lutibacter sp. A64]
MKKYFKYIVFPLIIILIILSFNTKTEISPSSELVKNTSKTIKIEVKKPISLEYYPLEKTKKVNHKLDSLLQRINKRQDFNGSVLVAKNGKIVYNNQVGYADFRKKQPINKTSLFQLASVSKQFTATAIMLLYQENKIKLTDTVTNYFPDFPYEQVTIKNLLNHTAGLPKYFWIAEHKWKKQAAPTNSEMMDLIASSKVQRFYKPGQKFDYSNTGYLVLASIVEKVSGLSFSTFVKQNIFDPLDMKNTFVYSFENDSVRKNQLDGYRLYKGWRHLKINSTVNDAIVGDKNVYTTSEDLYRWILGLNSGSLISKELLKLMYTKGETIYKREIPYGFGFRIDPKDNNIVYHHGKWNGFSTGLTQYLEEDLVVIVLEHSSYKGITSLTENVKSIVAENLSI